MHINRREYFMNRNDIRSFQFLNDTFNSYKTFHNTLEIQKNKLERKNQKE